MTDRVRTSISKVSVTLGLIITIVTLIAGGVRIVDLTSQIALHSAEHRFNHEIGARK